MRRLFRSWVVVIALLTPFLPVFAHADTLEKIHEYRTLLKQRAFVAGVATADGAGLGPDGWHVKRHVPETEADAPDAFTAWRIEDGALVVTPTDAPVSAISHPFPLPRECTHVSAVVLGRAETRMEALLIWRRGDEVLQSIGFSAIPGAQTERRRLNLPETPRPEDADNAMLELRVSAEAGTVYWDSVEVLGLCQYAPALTVTVNRVGYEQVAPKLFTVRANFKPREARFILENEEQLPVYQGQLEPPARIAGVGGSDWGGYYLRGRFSAMEEEGRFRIVVSADGATGASPWFEVRFDLLWERAFTPALQPFTQKRVLENDASGALLWAGPLLNGHTEMSLLWDLVRACSILQGRYRSHPNYALLHSEAYYGASRLATRVIQGDLLDRLSPAEACHAAAALSAMARLAENDPLLRDAAQLAADHLLRIEATGPLVFSAVWDLRVLTEDARYADPIARLFPGIALERVEPLLEYEEYAGVMLTIDLSNQFAERADAMLSRAANPYGLISAQGQGNPFFLATEENASSFFGNNLRLLAAAEFMAQAYRYKPRRDYLVAAYDQLNWILGNNPFGICLVKGLDGPSAPEHFGIVLHGIGPCSKEEDRPCLPPTETDAAPNPDGDWSLCNNARYLSALGYIKRIPVTRPRK